MLSNKPFHILLLLSTILLIYFLIVFAYGLLNNKQKTIKIVTIGIVVAIILIGASCYFINYFN